MVFVFVKFHKGRQANEVESEGCWGDLPSSGRVNPCTEMASSTTRRAATCHPELMMLAQCGENLQHLSIQKHIPCTR